MLEKIINIGSIIDPQVPLGKTAIIDLSREEHRTFSYKDIDDLSNAIARGLVAKGIKPKDKIAILADNSVEYLITFFGIMRMGAIAVLINNKLTESQINHIIKESNSQIVFTSEIFKNSLNDYLDFGDFDLYEPDEDHTAFLLYTSGSYGDPKGSIITHTRHAWSILRYVRDDKQWSDKRVCLISAPLYHANGLTSIESCIAGRSTVILVPKFDPQICIESIEKFKINTVYTIPTMLFMMIQHGEIQNYDLSSVRQIRCASSDISQKLIDNVKKYFPNTIITNNYGITEVGPGLFGPHPQGFPRPANSVGYPYPGIEYRVVNGILEVKSPSMMTSYYNQKTSSLTQDGFFITNDLFEVDTNGFYYFKGRADDMFKCGGNSVYPSQVEKLLEKHPSVASAFVLGLPDDIKGYKPYAFVILERGSITTAEELKEYTLQNGPAYQHPRRVWFVDSFPLAGTNKVSKKELENIAVSLLANQK